MDIRTILRFDGTLPGPGDTPGFKGGKSKARADLATIGSEMAELQEKLFANGSVGGTKKLLLVLQGMDASGKDGTVKHVVGQVNPAGVRITSFKRPTKDELAHDFLWRITNALPQSGQLGVFNRSHYEDVLVVRVHNSVPRATWGRRYNRINAFERRVVAAGCPVVKVFLHLSKDEQRARLLERLEEPTKHWKVGTADIPERHRWDDYQVAYLDALSKCNTDAAPWYVIPADRKWYRDWAVSHLMLETLREMELGWPTPAGINLKAMKKELLSEV